MVQLYHVGACFEALDALIFIAFLDFLFTFLDFPLERCAGGQATAAAKSRGCYWGQGLFPLPVAAVPPGTTPAWSVSTVVVARTVTKFIISEFTK